jgi:hypothetical protein
MSGLRLTCQAVAFEAKCFCTEEIAGLFILILRSDSTDPLADRIDKRGRPSDRRKLTLDSELSRRLDSLGLILIRACSAIENLTVEILARRRPGITLGEEWHKSRSCEDHT